MKTWIKMAATKSTGINLFLNDQVDLIKTITGWVVRQVSANNADSEKTNNLRNKSTARESLKGLGDSQHLIEVIVECVVKALVPIITTTIHQS